MSANDRKARHVALCGAKPGGAYLYYLKETCVLKDVERARRTNKAPSSGRGSTTSGRGTPGRGTPQTPTAMDYGKFCEDQVKKLRPLIRDAETLPKAPKKNTQAAVVGVAMQVMAKSLQRLGQRDTPLDQRLEQAVTDHNLLMDEKGDTINKATLGRHLWVEVVQLLHFSYRSTLAALKQSISLGS